MLVDPYNYVSLYLIYVQKFPCFCVCHGIPERERERDRFRFLLNFNILLLLGLLTVIPFLLISTSIMNLLKYL